MVVFPIFIRQSTALIDYFQQTILPPLAPNPLTPPNDDWIAVNPPPLTWEPEGVDSIYEIEIAENPEFSEPFVRESTTLTAFTPELFFDGGKYYWRVRVLQNDNPSNLSEVWSFKVGWRVSMPLICSQCQNISPVLGEFR